MSAWIITWSVYFNTGVVGRRFCCFTVCMETQIEIGCLLQRSHFSVTLFNAPQEFLTLGNLWSASVGASRKLLLEVAFNNTLSSDLLCFFCVNSSHALFPAPIYHYMLMKWLWEKRDAAVALKWSCGRLQESTCPVLGIGSDCWESDSAPSADLGEFSVLLTGQSRCESSEASAASHHFPAGWCWCINDYSDKVWPVAVFLMFNLRWWPVKERAAGQCCWGVFGSPGWGGGGRNSWAGSLLTLWPPLLSFPPFVHLFWSFVSEQSQTWPKMNRL